MMGGNAPGMGMGFQGQQNNNMMMGGGLQGFGGGVP